MRFGKVLAILKDVPEGTVIRLKFKEGDVKLVLYLAVMVGKTIPIFTVDEKTKKQIKKLCQTQQWSNRQDRIFIVRTTSTFGEAMNIDWFVTVMFDGLDTVKIMKPRLGGEEEV